MQTLTVQTNNATLAAIQKLADEENLSLEEMVQHILDDYIKSRHWPSVGLFDSGKTDTSERAEDILEKYWKPD